MELKVLNTLGIGRFFERDSFDCGCGRRHDFSTCEVFFGAGEMKEIGGAVARVAAACSKVVLLLDKRAKKEYERSLGKKLAVSGFRVQEVVLGGDEGVVASCELASSIVLEEDAKAIVAVGSEELIAVAKYKAAQSGLLVVAVPISPSCLKVLAPSAILLEDGIEQIFKTPPPKCVLFDTNSPLMKDGGEVASAFGAIVSKLVGLYDYRFASLINKEFFCKSLFDLSYAIIDSVLCRVATLSEASLQEKAAIIAEGSLKLSGLSQLMDNSRLFCGGEAQSAHVLRLLFKHEERKLKRQGENELILARLVVETYKNALTKTSDMFVPPPDNNLRLERISELLGLDETKVVKKMRPILSAEDGRLHAYRVSEFFDELMPLLSDLDFKLKSAWRCFKRLYEDDGFSLVNYIDDGDISLALSFAPDLKEKFTMLAYLKDAGYLEEYVLVG